MHRNEDRATAMGNKHKKFGEIWTGGSGDMLADRHTETRTKGHAQDSTPFRCQLLYFGINSIISSYIFRFAVMYSVILPVRRNNVCIDLFYSTCSDTVGKRRDSHTDRRENGHHTDALRFPLDVAGIKT